MAEWLDNMQIICTTLQTDNHAQHLITQFLQAGCSFLPPNQQCQSTEGKSGEQRKMMKINTK